MFIYLIHFQSPIGTERHQAQHYLGFVYGEADAVRSRLEQHRAGTGASILAHCNKLGIHYDVVRTIPGNQNFERHLKNRKRHSRLCPICSPSKN